MDYAYTDEQGRHFFQEDIDLYVQFIYEILTSEGEDYTIDEISEWSDKRIIDTAYKLDLIGLW